MARRGCSSLFQLCAPSLGNTSQLLQHCSICSLQAKVVGAVEVPLFVKDDDMSPAGLLKQVGADGKHQHSAVSCCWYARPFGR